MSFWDGMQLWEKMLLVLACAMVITFVFGIGKLLYGKRQVKQCTKVAEAQKTHLETVRGTRQLITLKGDEVPFGVRALEKGIEVEGIVISRPATPNSRRSQQTLIGSDADSARLQNKQMQQLGRPMVHQPSPYVSVPSPLYQGSGPSSVRSSATSLASVRNPFTQSYSPSASGTSTPQSGLGYAPDNALAKLEGNLSNHLSGKSPQVYGPPGPSYRTHSRTPTPPDGIKLPSVDENTTEYPSDCSDSDGLYEIPRPRLSAAYSSPAVPSVSMANDHLPQTARGDLSLLHTHRMTHAAEVGQLLPRHGKAPRAFEGAPQMPGMATATENSEYVLDIALPALPVPAARPAFSYSEHGRSYSDPSMRPGEGSRFMEDLFNQSAEESANSHAVDDASDHPKVETKKSQNKLRKKKGKNAMDVDLEAQH